MSRKSTFAAGLAVLALSVAGLRNLADSGLTQALLYVDESNTAAVGLYRKLGFEVYQTDVNYQRP